MSCMHATCVLDSCMHGYDRDAAATWVMGTGEDGAAVALWVMAVPCQLASCVRILGASQCTPGCAASQSSMAWPHAWKVAVRRLL